MLLKQAIPGLSLFVPGFWMLHLLSARVALHAVEQDASLGHAAHELRILMPGLQLSYDSIDINSRHHMYIIELFQMQVLMHVECLYGV